MNFVEDKFEFENKNVNFIYGLAGNPIHIGHIDVIKNLLEVKDAKVHVILSKKHAFGKNLMDYKVRKVIVEKMIYEYIDKEDITRIVLDDVESKIEKEGSIYSADIKKYFEDNHPDYFCVWVFGEDNCNEENIKRFKNYQSIVEWKIFKAKERINLHSTEIRKLILNENYDEVSKLTSFEVSNILKKEKDKNISIFEK